MPDKFIVIASFPKSGNTYVRSILARLIFGTAYPGSTTDIHREDPHLGSAAEIGGQSFKVFKTHATGIKPDYEGKPLDLGPVIWIRRHPLDVFLSFWHYLKLSADDISDATLRSRHEFSPLAVAALAKLPLEKELSVFLRAFITYGTLLPSFRAAGDWFSHCDAWEGRMRKREGYAIQYEQLVAAPVETLWPFAKALGFTRGQLRRAVDLAKADTAVDGKFFWSQRTYHYRTMLRSADIAIWYKLFGPEMARYGYGDP